MKYIILDGKGDDVCFADRACTAAQVFNSRSHAERALQELKRDRPTKGFEIHRANSDDLLRAEIALKRENESRGDLCD